MLSAVPSSIASKFISLSNLTSFPLSVTYVPSNLMFDVFLKSDTLKLESVFILTGISNITDSFLSILFNTRITFLFSIGILGVFFFYNKELSFVCSCHIKQNEPFFLYRTIR